MVKHTITNNLCYVLVSIAWLFSLWQSFQKICGKISPENSNRTPLPIVTMGRGVWESGYGRIDYCRIFLRVTMHTSEEEIDSEIGNQYRHECPDTEDMKEHRVAEPAK